MSSRLESLGGKYSSSNWNFISSNRSEIWGECIGPEGQIGTLRPYMANIAVNLWWHDLLQKWKTEINIPLISETNHKVNNASEINIKRSKEQL